MIAVEPNLRLSAQVALLGAIHPDVRLVKMRRNGAVITLSAVMAKPLDQAGSEALSIAATEIIADFPDCRIEERLIVSSEPIQPEDVLAEGWVCRRLEPSDR